MVIKITKRLKFKRCIGRNQVCILCERNMGQQTGLMIDSSCGCIVKNAWLCLSCIPNFKKIVDKALKKHKKQLVIESI